MAGGKKTTTIANPDIDLAMYTFRENLPIYFKAERYYRGDHDLQFATDKFKNAFGTLFREFALNLCPAIVDPMRDKLIVTEFGVEKNGDESGSEDLSQLAWQIWMANRMDVRSGQVHKEAVKTGNAYAIVWPGADGKVTIYPQRASTCMVVYDEETPGKIVWAAKIWRTNAKTLRLNLFYPDRIEKYESKEEEPQQYMGVKGSEEKEAITPLPMYIPTDGKAFKPVADTPIVANPYGIVPVFHFANNSDIGGMGMSELQSAIPVQDGLNKSVLDMLVAMEFASFRQRWITGIEVEYDDEGKAKAPFLAGVEKLWITENPEAKFGDFDATDLEQFVKVKEGFRTDLATVSGTPLHYFMVTGAAFPQSGISVEKLESRFLSKVRDRMTSFGQVWSDLMQFALTIENKGGVRLQTEWEDPAPLSESEQLANLESKQRLGIPDEQLWMEAGYGDADIKRMTEQKDAAQARIVKSFNAGEIPPGEGGAGPGTGGGN